MEDGVGEVGGRVQLEKNKENSRLQTDIGDVISNCSTEVESPVSSKTFKNGFNCLFANARSLHSKMGELEALVNEENYDFIGIAETWLCSSHDWAVNIPGYALFRRDRVLRKGGGVCIYVRNNIKVRVKEDLADGECNGAEVLWVELYTGTHNTKVIVGVCYPLELMRMWKLSSINK